MEERCAGILIADAVVDKLFLPPAAGGKLVNQYHFNSGAFRFLKNFYLRGCNVNYVDFEHNGCW
jgi:hypothetical protein